MSRFNSFLRDTGDRLSLPKATRSHILVEIASDLEDLFEHYRSQGLSEEEAAARAEEKVDISTEALAELVSVHSSVGGWTDRISRRPQPFWERIAMGLIVISLAAMAISVIDARLLSLTSVFIWPVLAIFLTLVGFSVSLALRFTKHRNHRRLRESLATPLFLGTASLVVGVGGFAVDLYRGLMRMAADPENAGPVLSTTLFGGTSTLMIAILVTLSSLLVWFVAAGRIARLERTAASTFMEV